MEPYTSPNPPRILIVGAGSRGNAYARAILNSTNGIVASVAEPIHYKRERFGRKYIWDESGPNIGQEFEDWREFVVWEKERRTYYAKNGQIQKSIDAAFICVLDEMHMEAIEGLAPLGIHIMCEKPLATNLVDCLSIYKTLHPILSQDTPTKIFSIGHVLRYSPHNILLWKLLREEKVLGEILSINHTEPIGWWHFTHSYVRGNWRKESITAPSLLTKSCHDIDFLLWILCSPSPGNFNKPHIPNNISSMGALQYFRKSCKPAAAGSATNCLSCPIEVKCKYSAKKVYLGAELQGLASGNRAWPLSVVVPDIEDNINQNGYSAGENALIAKLSENYSDNASNSEIARKNWFGRCVFECDNDVCDDQVVTMNWDESPTSCINGDMKDNIQGRGKKTAVFHMIAHTEKICQRYTNIYGSDGEIYADNDTISVHNFTTGIKKVYKPQHTGGGHGGGDDGLARQFVLAVDQVKNYGLSVDDAQSNYLRCSLEEIIRSHALVFAAEESRQKKKVIDFPEWWNRKIESQLTKSTRLT